MFLYFMRITIKCLFLAFGFLALCSSCREKKENDFFPVLSFINSQVKDVDTSLYPIIRADKRDSTWDTTYIKRDQFRALAKDFLDIPDLKKYSIGKKFKEDKFYDQDMNRVVLTYTPVKKNAGLDRQEIVIIPDPAAAGNDKVRSVIIEKTKATKDSLVTQHLLWQVDEKFQVVTVVEKNGQPISSKTMEVSWQKQF
jgi:hypothetical protein